MNKWNKWDKRFMTQAKLVSTWSKDPKHKLGAVIVDDRNKVISVGYNGPPRDVIDVGLMQKAKVFRSLHAELNAILSSDCCLKGAKIYIFPFSPCAQCAAAIIQKEIKEVIYYSGPATQIGRAPVSLSTWGPSQQEAFVMFKEAGVEIGQYPFEESTFWI